VRLDRKINVISALFGIGFLVILLVSLSSLILLESKASQLRDITHELDFLTTLKLSVEKTRAFLDFFMENPSSRNAARLMEATEDLYRIISRDPMIKLDEDEDELLLFIRKNFRASSARIAMLAGDLDGTLPERRMLYEKVAGGFLQKIHDDIDEHWKEDFEKVSRANTQVEQARLMVNIIFFVIAITVIVVFLSIRNIYLKKFVDPIRELNRMSRAMAGGDLSQRIAIKTDDEIEDLAGNFNAMANILDEKMSALTAAWEKEQKIVRELSILNELMGQISTEVKLDVTVKAFVTRVKDLLRADAAAVFVLEENDIGQKLFITTDEWLDERTCLSLTTRPVKEIFETQEIERGNDVRIPAGMDRVIHNFMILPVDPGKHIRAMLFIVNREEGFSQEDGDRLFSFAFQAFLSIALHSRIADLATTDGLTGLSNHRTFQERLAEELSRASRFGNDLSLLIIDIDHFKSINDTYGHQAGDTVLKGVAAAIRESIRCIDFAARYGGEEFVAILPLTGCSGAHLVAERIRAKIEETVFEHDGLKIRLTVSVGFACFPVDAEDQQQLIAKADEYLYYAKEHGRNMVYNPRLRQAVP